LTKLAEKQSKPKPEKFTRTINVFERSPAIVALALKKAAGVCGKCGKDAPFYSKRNGEPYLEIHHIKPLAEGGADHMDNTIALCPNCHREKHYG
jgi:5-methylcytosine-specific restriction protein A